MRGTLIGLALVPVLLGTAASGVSGGTSLGGGRAHADHDGAGTTRPPKRHRPQRRHLRTRKRLRRRPRWRPPTTEAAPPTTEAAPPTTEAAPPTTEAAPPTTEAAPPVPAAPTKAGPEPWAPMLARPSSGVTASAEVTDCASATVSSRAATPPVRPTPWTSTLTYGDQIGPATSRPSVQRLGDPVRSNVRAYWPSDGVWWVAVTVDDADGEAFAAARVPNACRRAAGPFFTMCHAWTRAGPRCRGSGPPPRCR